MGPAVTVLSAFVKNIGALAMLMPVAFFVARRSKSTPLRLPDADGLGSLLGGIVTLIGTSPNIIVSRVCASNRRRAVRMFDFAPVGIGIALAGVAFLAIGCRLLPRDRRGVSSLRAGSSHQGLHDGGAGPGAAPPSAGLSASSRLTGETGSPR